jgi:hypothetical protein
MQSRLPGTAPWRSVYDITLKALGFTAQLINAADSLRVDLGRADKGGSQSWQQKLLLSSQALNMPLSTHCS